MKTTWIGSPNEDSNRTAINVIFIHWFGDSKTTHDAINAVDNIFQKPNGTSAHYAIENTTVHQYVGEDKVAYHAGVYSWNQRSIGIEHSAGPNRMASTETYETSGKLVREIAKRHNIPLDREHIKAHNEVRATRCPGTMDIDRIIRIAKQDSEQTVREEANLNWDVFNIVMNALGVEADPKNKKKSAEKAVKLYKSTIDIYENRIEELGKSLRDEIKNSEKLSKQLAVKEKECQQKVKKLNKQVTNLKKQIKKPLPKTFIGRLKWLFYGG